MKIEQNLKTTKGAFSAFRFFFRLGKAIVILTVLISRVKITVNVNGIFCKNILKVFLISLRYRGMAIKDKIIFYLKCIP